MEDNLLAELKRLVPEGYTLEPLTVTAIEIDRSGAAFLTVTFELRAAD